tara:strand:+ start:8319 stop:9104 length:786 start_codon:yes stop_codon:yes gene_type:complete
MQIYLISHTQEPLKSIAAAQMNIGIGTDITTTAAITQSEAEDVVGDLLASFLNSPLEFASFNFFWQDVPIFMVRELVRHRIGWSYAERSLRFFDATKRDPLEAIDMDFFPSMKRLETRYQDMIQASGTTLLKGLFHEQMESYQQLLDDGVDAQDARSVIGVWYPTAIQTACSFRALRDMLALRLSSQAHPGWQEVARQIKALVTEAEPFLGAALTDICDIQQRCVWQSRLDRPCDDCAKRGREANHIHNFSSGQCTCGERG